MSMIDPQAAGPDPVEGERALLARLPDALARALAAPGWRAHLGAVEPGSVTNRERLAGLPVLRKSDLPALQAARPPFGGFHGGEAPRRIHVSPGPIAEMEACAVDPWQSAPALHAAGFRAGEVILNTFSYHLVPGGFIVESGAERLGLSTIPAGPGQVALQVEAIRRLRPVGYAGTPDFLKILLDQFPDGADFPIRRAFLSGGAFPASLRHLFAARAIACFESYATAELGVIAYEDAARDGLVVNENLIVEIVDPASGRPLPVGEVGEVVVTRLGPGQPWIRLATGDLSRIEPGPSGSGHCPPRLAGWLGRADQATKVKGMFVRPEHVARIAARHPGLGRICLQVTRSDERDGLTLVAEQGTLAPTATLRAALAVSLAEVTGLNGAVELLEPGALPRSAPAIDDRRAPALPAGSPGGR